MLMSRFITHTLILCFLFACSSEPSQTEAETEVEVEEVDTAEYLPDESGRLFYDQAIIVTSGVRSRSGPTVKDKIIRSFDFGEIVALKDSTDGRSVVTSGDACDEYGFKWYQVEDENGTQSWVFGKFLYQIIPENDTYKPNHSIFQLNGEDWFFGTALELSFGPSGDEGLTGCDVKYIPFFYQKDKTKIVPILYDPTIVRSFLLEMHSGTFSESSLLLTHASEGGSIVIKDLYISNKENIDLIMEMDLFYQDGTGEGTMSLKKNDDGFQVVNFTKVDNQ